MLWLFICFAGSGLVTFLAGAIWILAKRGQTHKMTGPEAGKEVMVEDDEALVQVSTFKGKAVYVEREASIGLDDIKAAFKAKDWGTILALLMMVGGFLSLCLCGGLSMLMML
jgi:hypothetical protein